MTSTEPSARLTTLPLRPSSNALYPALDDAAPTDHWPRIPLPRSVARPRHSCPKPTAPPSSGQSIASDGSFQAPAGSRPCACCQPAVRTRPIAQQLLEPRLILRRGNDQHLPDPGQHQHREGVVDQRLVVDRQQLLGDALGNRVQPCPRPAPPRPAPPRPAPPARMMPLRRD